MKFSGEKLKQLQLNRKKKENGIKYKQAKGTYCPYTEKLAKFDEKYRTQIVEIRDKYIDTIHDAPINLKYLMGDSDFILDWKKLKSTKFKMKRLGLTEMDLARFMRDDKGRPSKNLAYLL